MSGNLLDQPPRPDLLGAQVRAVVDAELTFSTPAGDCWKDYWRKALAWISWRHLER
ncbi:MAG: hypothetical protein J0L97_08140 [Alphaproteobacteria bacterium]|nr:hypothetical protein [Alphaproteobacteria bacterium]